MCLVVRRARSIHAPANKRITPLNPRLAVSDPSHLPAPSSLLHAPTFPPAAFRLGAIVYEMAISNAFTPFLILILGS